MSARSAVRLPEPTTNRLLAALPAAEYAALRPHLAVVQLDAGTTIYAPGVPARHAYFPLTGVASLVAATSDGAQVEAGMIGCEGLVGLDAILGADCGPLATLAQIPGSYARLPVAPLRAAVAPGRVLHRLVHRFAQALYVLAAQSAACNCLHPIEERCARWLLLTHDRVAADIFPLTHEFLGTMLGVSRPSVSQAMGSLQRAGSVAYHRGMVTICDRGELERAACECYRVIAGEYARLLGPHLSSVSP